MQKNDDGCSDEEAQPKAFRKEVSEVKTEAKAFSSTLPIYQSEDFPIEKDEENFLGSGSFGKVYKYHHQCLEWVAIKQFNITGSTKTKASRSNTVYQEANILSRLRHENIVRILGVIKWPDSVGLVGLILEYADNGNLQDLLSEGNHAVLSWSTRLRLTKEIVSGLAYIHNYNEDKTFCHGDLKPENILLTSKMQVKLADFGSASLIVATGSPATTLVVEHTKQYTLQYVDPDFLRDPLQEKKPCMDMYSLGCVLYAMISGKAPYFDFKAAYRILEGAILSEKKPNPKVIDDVEQNLKSAEELSIFNTLKKLMESCWSEPSYRPNSKAVDQELNEALMEEQDKAVGQISEAERSFTGQEHENPGAVTDANVVAKGEDVARNLILRKYQLELAERAIQGINCVIVSSTGSGKTYVALHICMKHLGGSEKKVVFLVPTVPLVQQHYTLFSWYLDITVSVAQVVGGNEITTPVAEVLDEHQVLIMTPQVLINALNKNECAVTDITLLIFDECHHAMKGHPYKQIMDRYMGEKRRLQPSLRLPQVVGLTASPGSGKANSIDKAMDHIIKFLGNLDVSIAPVQVEQNLAELLEYSKLDDFDTIPVDRRENDLFADALKKVMEEIESLVRALLDDNKSAAALGKDFKFALSKKRGSQKYEQDVVAFLDRSVCLADKNLSKTLQVYAEHLREYNNALLMNDHVRPSNARNYIEKALIARNPIDEQERNLADLYTSSGIIDHVSSQPSPLLQKLMDILQEHFSSRPDSRGIVFARTREIARSLVVCCQENAEMLQLSLRPEYLTGSAATSFRGGLTKFQQDGLLDRFKDGSCKLIFATTVAEEGLDIKACNLVVTYNHTTSEVAQVQRKGRGRAKDSKVYVLAYADRNFIAKERANAARNKLTERCLRRLREMDPGDLSQQIKNCQLQQFAQPITSPSRQQHNNRTWELLCKKCHQVLTNSEYIRRIKGMHHVVVDPIFPSKRFVERTRDQQISLEEIKVGLVKCGDETCRQAWGMQMLYKGVPFSVLKIDNLVLTTDPNRRETRRKWKSAPFPVTELSSEELAIVKEYLS